MFGAKDADEVAGRISLSAHEKTALDSFAVSSDNEFTLLDSKGKTYTVRKNALSFF
jgi:hypothetical protein